MADPSTNAKTTLVELCQRYTGRSMGKEDIVYQVAEHDDGFQATVRVDCIEGQEFAGELSATIKGAEQAAALQALEGLRAELLMGTGGKRKAELMEAEATVPLITKSKLREACKQILERDLSDGDVVYEVDPVDGGHMATLRLPTLPGPLGACAWVGGVSPYKRDTMLFAASEALEAILADPTYGVSMDLSKVPDEDTKKEIKKRSGVSGGQARTPGSHAPPDRWHGGSTPSAKGKGKGGKPWEDPEMWDWMVEMVMTWKGKGKGTGKGPCWGSGDWGGPRGGMPMTRAPVPTGAKGKLPCSAGACKGGGGKGRGAGAIGQPRAEKRQKLEGPNRGPNLPREQVTDGPVTGEVLEWKGSFGWIQPHETIDHPSAAKNRGRVYVSKQDVSGAASLAVGATVQFQAYSDSSGLGAEEVVVL